MNWQPIETAPKDGTAVLLYYPRGIWDGAWNDHEGRALPDIAVMRCDERGYWHGYYDATSPADEPTHWHPLPEPPSPPATAE